MKRFLVVLSILLFFLFFTSTVLAAPTLDGTGGGTNSLCPPSGSLYSGLCNLNLGKAIGNFITFLFFIAIIAALFYLIWGGLKWITSAGDKTALQGAREHIVAAIVGLIIIFLSYLILNFVVQFFLPGFNITDFKIPKINQ